MKITTDCSWAAMLVAVTACGGDPSAQDIAVDNEVQHGVSWEQYRDAAAVKLDGRDYYRVEWDLFFESEAALRKHYDQQTTQPREKLGVFRHTTTGFEPTFPMTEALDLKYCISNSFSNKTTVSTDAAGAMSDWEKVINVRFRWVQAEDASCSESNANVDFAILPTTVPHLAGCGASKKLWSGGCPVGGGTVTGVLLIQYGVIPFPTNPAMTPRGVFRHELGHLLGFRHEFVWAPTSCELLTSGTVTGRQVTDGYDIESVMGYPSECGMPAGDTIISAQDGIGARRIYGPPAAWHLTWI
jgi:hypothetical protein